MAAVYPLPSLYTKCKDVKNSKEWVAIHGMSALVGRKPDAMEVLEVDHTFLGCGTADVRARPTDATGTRPAP